MICLTSLPSLLTIVALIVTSGALHEDGLADVADGFYGGHSVERRLAIMKDSSIGSYGTLALIVSVLMRTSASGRDSRPSSGQYMR